MNKITTLVIFIFFSIMKLIARKTNKETVDKTPVAIHGRLKVRGKYIKDKNLKIFQLRGVSTHGIGLASYYEKFASKESFEYMRDNWKINAVRLAMYSKPDCHKENSKDVVKEKAWCAIEAGLYVIIDWHVLKENDPNIYKAEAIEFFKEMATEFKDYPNVLYEICNEPSNVTWKDSVKPYALDVISEIRKIDKKAIIIVGSSSWSTDVQIVVDDQIEGYDNLVYSYHFYAGSWKQKDRDRVQAASDKGLPIFVSECGMVKSNGDGGVYVDEASLWIKLLDDNKIGYMVWQLTNKDEGSSLISHECQKYSNWTYDELSDHGKWLYDTLQKYNKKS